MSLMSTEQHVSAQVWTCTRCGGEDPKSCGCAAATATSREIREKLATKTMRPITALSSSV